MTSLNSGAPISLKSVIAPAFWPVHSDIRKEAANSVYWLKGGRGSTKSSFVAIEIVLGMVADPNANALILRKVGDTIRTSVLENIQWAIEVLGLTNSWHTNTSPAQATYLPTGQKIIFKGLDEAKKLKSIKLKRGYFKFLWFEEADEFNGMTEIRNVEQSVLRGGVRFVEFITYNPPNDPANWVNVEVAEEEAAKLDPDYKSDRCVHHSTYLQVPPEWLGPKFLADAEKLRIKDPLAYEHEYLGNAVGRAEQIIFHGYWKEKEFETPDNHELYQQRFFYGADWGFSQDPMALIRCYIMLENGENNLYIDQATGGKGIELNDQIRQMFDSMPEARKWKWYGDNSRPETVNLVAGMGFNIEGAAKWPGSVEDGIEYLKSFDNIYVHPRCVKVIEEFKKYSFKVDKNTKEILPVIVDKWNHYMDALRYALGEYITREVSIFDVL